MIVLVNKGQEEFEDTNRVTRIRKSKDRQQMPKSFVHKKGTFSGSFRYPLHIYMFDCI